MSEETSRCEERQSSAVLCIRDGIRCVLGEECSTGTGTEPRRSSGCEDHTSALSAAASNSIFFGQLSRGRKGGRCVHPASSLCNGMVGYISRMDAGLGVNSV
ncbi:hypothetical protein TNCV_1510711 [Trichonephila clavipes]|nr:hypothetical protein TNCV_1510711 [Trichonephila clavipes]